MNKKGLSYVDWAISLGIFLVFTLTIFVVFKPHVIEYQSVDYLVSIAEQGIKEYSYYEIERYPLFVKPSESVDNWLEVDMGSYSALFSGNIRVYDSNLNLVSHNTNGDNLYLGDFDYNLVGGTVYEFGILRSELAGFADDETNSWGPIVSCLGDENTECTFGVVEKLRGFSESNVSSLLDCGSIENYNSFKEIIKYPSARDLSVIISGEGADPAFDCGFREPQESDNVFAFNWADNMLQNDGTKVPVNVEVMVW